MSLHLPRAIADTFQKNGSSRRDFLKASGALVVSMGVNAFPGGDAFAAAAGADGPYVDPDFRQLDTWIVIHPDNTATFLSAKPMAARAPAPPSAR